MGWLCSGCGTENRILTARCRACRRIGSVWERADGLIAAGYERLSANRPGTFSQGKLNVVKRSVGGANRVAGIVICFAAVFGVLLMLYMSRDAVRSGALMSRLNRAADTAIRLFERAQERGEALIYGFELSGGQWAQAGGRFAELGRGAEQMVNALSMMLVRGGQRFSDRIALIGQELPLADLHITAWTLNALYDLRDFLESTDIELLEVLADGVRLLCDAITELREWQWSLRG